MCPWAVSSINDKIVEEFARSVGTLMPNLEQLSLLCESSTTCLPVCFVSCFLPVFLLQQEAALLDCVALMHCRMLSKACPASEPSWSTVCPLSSVSSGSQTRMPVFQWCRALPDLGFTSTQLQVQFCRFAESPLLETLCLKSFSMAPEALDALRTFVSGSGALQELALTCLLPRQTPVWSCAQCHPVSMEQIHTSANHKRLSFSVKALPTKASVTLI